MTIILMEDRLFQSSEEAWSLVCVLYIPQASGLLPTLIRLEENWQALKKKPGEGIEYSPLIQ